MPNRSEFRSFVLGSFMMLIASMIIQHTSPEYNQFQEIKQLRAECEKFLPRNEHCKIVLMPTSKD